MDVNRIVKKNITKKITRESIKISKKKLGNPAVAYVRMRSVFSQSIKS